MNLKSLFVSGLIGISLLGCAVPAMACEEETAPVKEVIVVTAAPPAPIVEVVVRAPSANHVWVGGHWSWTGRRYIWRAGYWAVHPGYRYVQGYWYSHTNHWHYRMGYWYR